MFDEPSITTRDAQPYVAIVTAVTMEGFDVVEGLTDEVVTWIGARGAVPAGSPLVRIVTSDMSGELDIEVGVPVNDPPPGDDRFVIGSIPRGLYVTLIYTATTTCRRISNYRRGPRVRAWRGKSIAAAASKDGAVDSKSSVLIFRARASRSSSSRTKYPRAPRRDKSSARVVMT